MMRAAICNNMVMPYTNRLFNYISGSKRIDLEVISCTLREGIRTSSSASYAKHYRHVVLKGIEIPLETTRISHINSGMWSALKKANPDVVAINGIYPTMIIAAAWALAHQVPLTFLTDGWRHTMPQSPYHRIVRPLIVNRCKSIICASEKGRRYFMEQGVDERRIFIAPIVPSWDAPAQVPGFEQRPYHLLWCGRLNESPKNAGFLIDLAIAMHKRIRDFRCRIVGDGPMRQELLERLSGNGVTFEYSENVRPEEMAKVFVTGRVLVLPSKLEAWGLVCNEAMQCGTPAVVSCYTGVADELVVNGKTGFVRDLNVGEWVDTVEYMAINPTVWMELSKAGQRMVTNYNIQNSASNYIGGLLFAANQSPGAAREGSQNG